MSIIKKNFPTFKLLSYPDIKYFIKGGLWLFQSYILSTCIGLLLAWVYANQLTKATFGEFTFTLSFLSMLGIFTLQGMNQSSIYAVVEKNYGNIKIAISHTFWFSLVGTFILLLVGLYFFVIHRFAIGLSLIFLAVIFPLYAISNSYQPFLVAEKKFKRLSLIANLAILLNTCAVLFVILYKPLTLFLVIASILPTLLINLFFLVKLIRSKNYDFSRTNYNHVTTGWHLSIIFYLHLVSKSVDKIIIGLLLPFESLALYSIALLIPDRIFSSTNPLMTLIIPKVAENNYKTLLSSIYKKYLLLTLIIVIIIITYFFLSEKIFLIFFPKFTDSLFLTRLYSLSLLSIPTYLFTIVFQKMNKNKYLYFQDIALVTTLIISLFLLVPKLGLIGAVISQVTAQGIYSVITIFLFMRLIKLEDIKN